MKIQAIDGKPLSAGGKLLKASSAPEPEPSDGKTRIYIHLDEGRLSPMLGCCPNGTVTVDWGDGTEPDVLTGTSITTVVWTPTHTYAAQGDYVIKLTVDGSMRLYGQAGSNLYSGLLRYSATADARNQLYQNRIQKVKIGDGVVGLESAAIHSCHGLRSIAFGDEVTYIGGNAFYSCFSLESLEIPSGITNIPGNAFYGCRALASVTVPASVASIAASAFNSCWGVKFYDFTACAAVPTLANTNAFSGIAEDCEIRVPSALVEEWKGATNWASYADRIVGV